LSLRSDLFAWFQPKPAVTESCLVSFVRFSTPLRLGRQVQDCHSTLAYVGDMLPLLKTLVHVLGTQFLFSDNDKDPSVSIKRYLAIYCALKFSVRAYLYCFYLSLIRTNGPLVQTEPVSIQYQILTGSTDQSHHLYPVFALLSTSDPQLHCDMSRHWGAFHANRFFASNLSGFGRWVPVSNCPFVPISSWD
jgi:hypothetical protein